MTDNAGTRLIQGTSRLFGPYGDASYLSPASGHFLVETMMAIPGEPRRSLGLFGQKIRGCMVWSHDVICQES